MDTGSALYLKKHLEKLGIHLPIVDTKGPNFRLPLFFLPVGGSKESYDA